jgi:phosphoserine phosphatase RsbU/P
VVLALLVLEPGSGKALYSSAGAEPLLVVRAGGEAEVVEHPGLPLGIERGAVCRDRRLHLGPRDTAVLLTDGITEARNGRELLGYPHGAARDRGAAGALA